ncbi:MAG: signal recognition particle-docking protein FtsY [Hyphomicrobiaceae bacterium]|nr:signal recognition particle-docking protein FtsY [Hyphomicrobiaceae bacterium]
MTEPEKKRGLFGRLFGGAAKSADKPAVAPEPDQEPLSDAESSTEAEPLAPTIAPETAAAEPTRIPVTPATAPASVEELKPKVGWFARLTSGLAKTSAKLTEGITSVFIKRKLDAETIEDLEDLLISADLGLETTDRIIATLRTTRYEKAISPDEVRQVLADEVKRVLTPVAQPFTLSGTHAPEVILFVGVNGTGKTTTIGKLAERFRRDGKTVMLAAGDTFRAAAIEQLKVWGDRTGAPVIARGVGSDAASLAFDALSEARIKGVDVLMIDTAGRLQNKQGLMEELEKVIRVIRKVDATAPHQVLLVLDATTGQNALNQVEVFEKTAGVTGLVMTKLDGTARGGILVAISAKFKLPVVAIGVGESVEDLQSFNAEEFAHAIALG